MNKKYEAVFNLLKTFNEINDKKIHIHNNSGIYTLKFMFNNDIEVTAKTNDIKKLEDSLARLILKYKLHKR